LGQDSNFEAARRFAEFGLKEKAAGKRESASGPGSYLGASAGALKLLRAAIVKYDIRSILDLGCGDWHWMSRLGQPDIGGARVSYEGWDASAAMVADLNERYGTNGVSFHTKDITQEPLPSVDLIVARDVLCHIDIRIVRGLVERIRGAARLFLSTSFLEIAENRNIEPYLPIEGWGFHKLNLNVAPFDIARFMVESVEEKKARHTGHKRYLCLYDFSGADRP
jgi:SAM-dependent methyltransferase